MVIIYAGIIHFSYHKHHALTHIVQKIPFKIQKKNNHKRICKNQLEKLAQKMTKLNDEF
jgi:hypothetical protein